MSGCMGSRSIARAEGNTKCLSSKGGRARWARRRETHVMVGATAGLRLLPDGKADVILDEVRAALCCAVLRWGGPCCPMC